MAKKKRSTGFKVFMIILKTFLTVSLMITLGIVSYKLTMRYFEVTETPKETNTILDIVSEATADEISRNIIYSVNEENSKIEAIVIEVLNTTTNNLDYITIPANSQFSLSNDLFRRLYMAEVDIPQIVKLSNLRKYIKDDTAYEYGELILEEHFGIDLGYFTALSSDDFNKIFKYSRDTGYYKLSDNILSEAGALESEDDMESFIKDKFELFTTNIKLKSKLKYAETYLNVNPEMIYYYLIPGEEKGGVYEPDEKQAEKMYSTILIDTPHTVKQEEEKVISSEDKNIKVLNGSGGEGIAGKVKGILATEGFTVGKIADNPKIIEKTIIYVKEEGMGKDLLTYFNGATIEVGVPDEDFDIVIVVGSADKEIKAEE